MKVDIRLSMHTKNRLALESNENIKALRRLDSDGISNWIDGNVSDIEDVKGVLSILILAITNR
jgi:hypothetical protein